MALLLTRCSTVSRAILARIGGKGTVEASLVAVDESKCAGGCVMAGKKTRTRDSDGRA